MVADFQGLLKYLWSPVAYLAVLQLSFPLVEPMVAA